MFRRVLLVFTFVAALGAAGLGMSSKAMAGHRSHDDYGYSNRYPAYATYYSYGPRAAYYPSRPAYSDFGGYHGRRPYRQGSRHYNDRGVRISFGF